MCLFLATAIALSVASTLLVPAVFPRGFLDRLWQLNPRAEPLRHFGTPFGAFLVILGAASAIDAAGLLRGRKWAWWLAVVMFAANGAGDLISVVATGDALRGGVGVAVAAVFLYLLMRPAVRRYVR